jgi:acetamidase/formamidase
MQRVTRDKISYVFDRRLEPVLRVASGEVFQVETEDSRTGQTRTPETTRPEFLRAMRAKGYHGNPVTGPIYVGGAQPGDTLAVHIREMRCDTLGYFGYWPFLYHLDDWLTDPVTELVEIIRDGYVRYEMQTGAGTHLVRFPVRPMIGTIGTAPPLEVVASGSMGRHAGNLDVPEICPGSTVYLPVAVPGALLSLGDCHAHQGDGEVSGIEMRSEVTLSATVLKGWTRTMSWVRVETPTHLVSVACDRPLESAQWLAIREMILWLEERYGWTKVEARRLLGLVCDLRPGQAQVGLYSMRLLVPKDQLPLAAEDR